MKKLIIAAAMLLTAASAPAQKNDLEAYDRIIYKSSVDPALALYVRRPDGVAAGASSPAIVFFFGGGWTSGTVGQFLHQADHFAGRGMVAVLVDYRVFNRYKTPPTECVADVKSAMRYLRAHAAGLGIDPDRIVASGGSAGGHLAAATAYVTAFDDPADDREVSPRPQALVLFNPVADNSPETGVGSALAGGRWRDFSPMHNITPQNVVPTLFMIGSRDKHVAPDKAELYAETTRKAGGECKLIIYEGAEHGFFNYREGKDLKYYNETLGEADAFLVKLGFIKPLN